MNVHFNIDLKRQYSWLPKGVTNYIIWTTITGRWSMFVSILSNGEFLWLIVDNTGNSDKFWGFKWITNYAIDSSNIKSSSNWIITLDNASIHKSSKTVKSIKDEFNLMFLFAYSPMLAPVELFFRMIKNRLRTNSHYKQIWLNKQAEIIKIFNV